MKNLALFGVVFAVLALVGVGTARASFAPQEGMEGDGGGPSPYEDTADIPFLIAPEDRPDMGYSNTDNDARNIEAFGACVAKAEGTARGPNAGYNVLFGWPAAGRTFDANSATDHPRMRFPFRDTFSSAAGRYQINAPTYDDMRARYRLPAGFTPEAQERLFVAILDACGALPAVKAGRFAEAIDRARTRWASLPGAGNDQPERSFAYVREAYLAAGGTIA